MTATEMLHGEKIKIKQRKFMEKLISIVGLTSSGKSALGIELAKKFNGEIVSADSRQVYIGLDWCSGKVSKEEQQVVKHHLLDVVELGTRFTLFDFQQQAYKSIDDIVSRGKVPLLVGGTGLYSRSVVEGYNLIEQKPDENLRKNLENMTTEQLLEVCKQKNISVEGEITNRRLVRLIETANNQKQPNKPRYKVLQIGVFWERDEIYKRIEERLKQRMPFMIEEIKNLLKRGIDANFLKELGLEAKFIVDFLDGKFESYDEFFEELFKEERHFAKRQNTWYNKEQNLIWLDAKDNLFEKASKLVQDFLAE